MMKDSRSRTLLPIYLSLDYLILKSAREIERQTGKSISLKQIYNIRQQIKKDSYDWYTESESKEKYEYLHEFKERINEILWLQSEAP